MTKVYISRYWERRGCAIYTEGAFESDEYIAGSAELVIDFNNQIHVDHIDHIIKSHNDALDDEIDDLNIRPETQG